MDERLRVLEIISGFAIEGPLGGIERFTVELVKALPPDISPIVCGMWDYHTPSDQEWLHHLRDHGIEAFIAAPWQAESPYASFRRCVRDAQAYLAGQTIDVIHSHCQFGDGLALLLRAQVKAQALVRTVHNEREWPRRPERRLLFTHLLAPLCFDLELGVSRTVVANLNARPVARSLKKRARLCHNSLNLARFHTPPDPTTLDAYRAELSLPPDALVIGSVGRLEIQKGYTHLLDAMPAIVAACPRAHLVLAGDGTLAEALRAQAAASPVAAHLHLVGPQRQIERLYGLLDLFVSSSLWEGLPTVLLESIAAGVPIVATLVSGSRDLIEEGVSGRLVPPGDAPSLAQAVIALLQAPNMRRQMAAQAKPILAQFDIAHAADFHTQLYFSLLDGPPDGLNGL